MTPFHTVLGAARTWHKAQTEYIRMLTSANEVIRQRCTQMALGTMRPDEATRMVLEKPSAFVKSFEMAARAQAGSKGAAEVALASIKPIVAATSSNARRLKTSRR